MPEEKCIKVSENGPYLVPGSIPIRREIIATNEKGESVDWQDGDEYTAQESCALCRCGGSGNKPYCDSTHLVNDFNGTETASRSAYAEQAETTEGPELILTDAKPLCAHARFCSAGIGAWEATRQSDDQESKDMAIRESQLCPSGRLIAWDKPAETQHEPDYAQSIGLIEDPVKDVSGPLWIRGAVSIEAADGTEYEKRNRVTLCRCGNSKNKPFCDGSHISARWRDDI